MDKKVELDLFEQMLVNIKKVNERFSEVNKRFLDYVEKTEFITEINRINEELKYLQDMLEKYKKYLNDDFYENVKSIQDIKLKIDVIENNIKNFVDYSYILELRSKINDLSNRLKELENKIENDLYKIYEIEKLQEDVRNISTEVNSILEDYVKKEDFQKIKEEVEKLSNTFSENINKIIDGLIKFDEYKNEIEEVKEKYLGEIKEDINNLNRKVKDIEKRLLERIEKLEYLNEIDKSDIKNIKQLSNLQSLYEKYVNFENKLNGLYTFLSDLQNITYELKNKILDIAELKGELEKIEKLENEIKEMKTTIEKLKYDILDFKDMAENLMEEYREINDRLRKIESIIDVTNLENIFTEVEKIKILENDIEKLKKLIYSINLKEKNII
ncbi:MAG: hypothetical protein ACPLX8_01190 [Nanopusillaceae archaeon]